MISEVLTPDFLQENISNKVKDKWEDTLFAGYSFLSNSNKGVFGENFVSKLMSLKGSVVTKRSNAGHDRTIDGYKTEIKFSLSNRDITDQSILNHVSKDKDWDRLIYYIVNDKDEDHRFIWFTKEDFLTILESPIRIFNTQQGGKKINNDDYMCSNIVNLINHPLVKGINEW